MPHKGIQKYIYEEKICKQIVKSIFWTPFLCFSLGVTTLDYIFHPKWRQLSYSPRMDTKNTFRKTKFKNNFSFPFLDPLKNVFFKYFVTPFPGTTYTYFNKKWSKLSTTSPVGPENQFIRRNILQKL